MTEKAAIARQQIARLRQFFEQADARLLLLVGADKTAADPARIAEIARLERLRSLALRALDEAEASA